MKTLVSESDVREKIKGEINKEIKKPPMMVDFSSDEPKELLKRILWMIQDKDYGSLNEVRDKNRNLKVEASRIYEIIYESENKQNKDI